MIAFPNAKINLGLRVLNRRPDGYHDLETVFYPVGLQDILEIIPAPNSDQSVEFSSSGLELNISAEDNLCVKAWKLLKQDFPQLPSVKMHLHKIIPHGAGLGGGSANASFTLKMLNDLFKLTIHQADLAEYALKLGSDCPFFLVNKPSLATGRGEILTGLPVDLSNYSILLVNPKIHIGTAWAFAQLRGYSIPGKTKEIVLQAAESWKTSLVNDFEAPVFAAYPELKAAQEKLYTAGAVWCGLSGTGSCMIALFRQAPALPLENFPGHYGFKIL